MLLQPAGPLVNQHAGALVRHALQHRAADAHLLSFGQPASGNRHGQLMFVEQAQHAAIGAGLLDDDRHDFVHQLLRIENPHQLFANALNQPQLDFGERFARPARQ